MAMAHTAHEAKHFHPLPVIGYPEEALAEIVIGEPTVEPGAGDVTLTLTPLELLLAVR